MSYCHLKVSRKFSIALWSDCVALKHQYKEKHIAVPCWWLSFIHSVGTGCIYLLHEESSLFLFNNTWEQKGHSRDKIVKCFVKILRMKFSNFQLFPCFPRSGVWKAVAEFLWDLRHMDSSMGVTVTLSSTLTLEGRSSIHGMLGCLCTGLQCVDIILYCLYVLLSRTRVNVRLFTVSLSYSISSGLFWSWI